MKKFNLNNEYEFMKLGSETYKLRIHLKNLSMQELCRSKGNFSLTLEEKNEKDGYLKIHVLLYEKFYKTLHLKKSPTKRGFIKIQADNTGCFSILLDFIIKKSLLINEKDQYACVFEYISSENFEIRGQYSGDKKAIDKVSHNSNLKRNSVGMHSQNKYQVSKELLETVKKEKEIIKTTLSAYKKCANCHFFERGMCGLFGIRVEKNEICKKFYAPKTKVYTGGRFSPK